MPDTWRRVRIGGVELDVPADVGASAEQGVEGSTGVLSGRGIRVTVDGSPFADPLTGYASRPHYAERSEEIADHQAEVVSFKEDDGTTVVGARLAGPVTATVHLPPDVDPEIALRMLRSIRPTDPEG